MRVGESKTVEAGNILISGRLPIGPSTDGKFEAPEEKHSPPHGRGNWMAWANGMADGSMGTSYEV